MVRDSKIRLTIHSSTKMHYIPSVRENKKYVMNKEARIRRTTFRKMVSSAPKTRNQWKQNIPIPDSSGWYGKMLFSVQSPDWNRLAGKYIQPTRCHAFFKAIE